MLDFMRVDESNIEKEHICCSISDKKGEFGVSLKKEWLKSNFKNGLVFLKLNTRGKVFIEYIPAEYAWVPIKADGYMHVNCFWVAGQYKGNGYANQLLDTCILDAKEKGKHGLTVVASKKKQGYLSDPDYLRYKGFLEAGTASPYFVLYYLPFDKTAPIPVFSDSVKQNEIEEKGLVLYYTNQCPFTDKYVRLMQEVAKQYDTSISLHKINTREEAQHNPSPFTAFTLFYEGTFITHEIMSEKKFEKFLLAHNFQK